MLGLLNPVPDPSGPTLGYSASEPWNLAPDPESGDPYPQTEPENWFPDPAVGSNSQSESESDSDPESEYPESDSEFNSELNSKLDPCSELRSASSHPDTGLLEPFLGP